MVCIMVEAAGVVYPERSRREPAIKVSFFFRLQLFSWISLVRASLNEAYSCAQTSFTGTSRRPNGTFACVVFTQTPLRVFRDANIIRIVRAQQNVAVGHGTGAPRQARDTKMLRILVE